MFCHSRAKRKMISTTSFKRSTFSADYCLPMAIQWRSNVDLLFVSHLDPSASDVSTLANWRKNTCRAIKKDRELRCFHCPNFVKTTAVVCKNSTNHIEYYAHVHRSNYCNIIALFTVIFFYSITSEWAARNDRFWHRKCFDNYRYYWSFVTFFSLHLSSANRFLLLSCSSFLFLLINTVASCTQWRILLSFSTFFLLRQSFEFAFEPIQ